MVYRTALIAGISAMSISGCAKQPDAISPATVPASAYSNMNCETLAAELLREQTKLNALSKTQRQAAVGDAVGVFLVGVPASSLLGQDKEGQIAVSKGQVVAIEANIKRKGC